jgi:histidine kinase
METEEFLKEDKYYRTLIQSATDYVVAVNRKYRVIMANERFKNEFGMKPNDYCYKVWKNKNEKCEECLVERDAGQSSGRITKIRREISNHI